MAGALTNLIAGALGMPTTPNVPVAVTLNPRYFGPITALMTIDERGTDKLTITKHPVAIGASITDHSYLEPAELQLRMMATNSAVENNINGQGTEDYCKNLYEKLRTLQASRVTFPIQTGKRLYQDMLIETLSLTTDEKSEHALMLQIGCKQIIKVYTSVVQAPVSSDPTVQTDPQQTAPPVAAGTKQATPATSPEKVAPGSWMAKAAAIAPPSLEPAT